jgi:hypothetical protein
VRSLSSKAGVGPWVFASRHGLDTRAALELAAMMHGPTCEVGGWRL